MLANTENVIVTCFVLNICSNTDEFNVILKPFVMDRDGCSGMVHGCSFNNK